MDLLLFLLALLVLIYSIYWAVKKEWKVESEDIDEVVEENKIECRVSYHVVPYEDFWAVKSNKELIGTYNTKTEAIESGMILAKSHVKGQLVIHKSDGVIQEERTYGDDPQKTRG